MFVNPFKTVKEEVERIRPVSDKVKRRPAICAPAAAASTST